MKNGTSEEPPTGYPAQTEGVCTNRSLGRGRPQAVSRRFCDLPSFPTIGVGKLGNCARARRAGDDQNGEDGFGDDRKQVEAVGGDDFIVSFR